MHDSDDKADDDKLLSVPADAYRVTEILFFFLGLLYVLPTNFFVTANKYWMYKFRNTSFENATSEDRTDLQAQFSATITISLQVANITFLYLTVLFGHKIRARIRMVGGISVMLCLFLLTTIFVKVDTDDWQYGFFITSMIIIAGVNAMNAVLTITTYSIISNFPPDYLGPYMYGQGLSEIFSSTLQILSLATGMSQQNTALVYFIIGSSVILFTFFLVISMRRNKFYRYHMRNYQDGSREKTMTFTEAKRLLGKVWSSILGTGLWVLTVSPISGTNPLVVSEGEGDGPWNDIYFVPVITFFLGSLSDVIGRQIAIRTKIFIPGIWVVVLSASRIFIFVPLLMLCNAQPRHHLPVAFPHDYQYIILVICYAMSNGFLICIYTFNIPKLVEVEERSHAFQVFSAVDSIFGAVFSPISVAAVNLL